MMRGDPKIEEGLRELVSALSASDPRAINFQKSSDDDAVSRLLESLLADSTVDLRISHLALWLVPFFPTRPLIARVVEVIRNRPLLAVAAGIKLGKLDDPTVFPMLEQILLDSALPPKCRAGAASAFAELRDPRVAPLLARALRSAAHEPIVASQVALTLGYVQLRTRSKDATRDLCSVLKSEFPDVRLAAITALGNMFAFDAIVAIEALREDPGVTTSGQLVGQRAQEVSTFLRGQATPPAK